VNMVKLIRPYQAEAAMQIYERQRVLIADDMGLGKTAEAILGKNLIDMRQGYNGKAIVICPSAVMQHWDREIVEWYKGDPRTTHIYTTSFDEDVKRVGEMDFTIIGFPTLSKLGGGNGKLMQLLNSEFQYGIIDEAHNAKNPASLRSSASRELLHSVDYLAILTGTPLPNTVVDIYSLMNLLDPIFHIDSENPNVIHSQFYQLFKQNPNYIRLMINNRMLRRTPLDVALDTRFPDLSVNRLEVVLDGEHRDTYLEVYENDDLGPGQKLSVLIGTSIDPNLAPADKLGDRLASRVGNMKSSVYTSLDSLVERVVDEGGKVLIFTDLKKRVTVPLTERYLKFGAEYIDGSVRVNVNGDRDRREEIRRRFQRDRDHKVLISTTVMDEGVDLTAATDVVHLTLPYTPAVIDQRNRRAQRIGEIEKWGVNAHIMIPKLDMIPVVTEGIEQLIKEKRRVISYILQSPHLVTREDFTLLRSHRPDKTGQLGHLLNPKGMYRHFGSLNGYRRTGEYYRKNPGIAENVARIYAAHWDGYLSGNTGELYSRVIAILKDHDNLERKLDIASGPFSLSRALQEPVMNVDINPKMVEVGRILAKQGKVPSRNRGKISPLHELPFRDRLYDLAVCSLALHMTQLKSGSKNERVHEREQAFREMNRVLRLGGYSIITLPNGKIDESDLPRFYDSLGYLGFEVLPFSGFYKGDGDKRFRVYMAGFKKVRASEEDLLDPNDMKWQVDKKRVAGRPGRKRRTRSTKKRKSPIGKEPDAIKPEIVNDFYHTGTNRALDEMVMGCFVPVSPHKD
jgi:ubiquinone/menaquinone biosynthesis C-methylase UbiE/superfamily II DNA or RNA helicase